MWKTVIAAALLGLVTGAMIGLSASEVVAAVVAALVSLATALVGLGGNKLLQRNAASGTDATDPSPDPATVIGFAIGLALGLSGGLYTRTHDLLSPGPSEITARWEAAGFETPLARRIAAHQLLGIDIGVAGEPAALVPTTDSTGHSTANSVLFSGAYRSRCASTQPARAPNRDELLNTWHLAGEPWKTLAATMDDDSQANVAQIWSALCAPR